MSVPRFYVYDDPEVTLTGRMRCKVGRGTGCAPECSAPVTEDQQVHQLLLRHPARTDAPEAAQLFVIPTPLLRFWACHGSSSMARANNALLAVVRGRWFARSGGHDHLLLAHSWRELAPSVCAAMGRPGTMVRSRG